MIAGCIGVFPPVLIRLSDHALELYLAQLLEGWLVVVLIIKIEQWNLAEKKPELFMEGIRGGAERDKVFEGSISVIQSSYVGHFVIFLRFLLLFLCFSFFFLDGGTYLLKCCLFGRYLAVECF
jgi:hypothetical protein